MMPTGIGTCGLCGTMLREWSCEELSNAKSIRPIRPTGPMRLISPSKKSLAFDLPRGDTEGRSSAIVQEDLLMSLPLSAPEVLSREFLEIRAKILEIAAAFDRLERAAGDVSGDPRIARLREALKVLGDKGEDRAEQVQLVFSRAYEIGRAH